jgi:hypothetical protein
MSMHYVMRQWKCRQHSHKTLKTAMERMLATSEFRIFDNSPENKRFKYTQFKTEGSIEWAADGYHLTRKKYKAERNCITRRLVIYTPLNIVMVK